MPLLTVDVLDIGKSTRGLADALSSSVLKLSTSTTASPFVENVFSSPYTVLDLSEYAQAMRN